VAAIATPRLDPGERGSIGADPGDRRGKPAAGTVVTAVVRGGPRADTWCMTPDLHDLVERERIELKRCLALLAEAIAQADRWYARREADLTALDRRARARVDRLRTEHRIDASIAWHSA
jgi:hypothetical protein